MNLDPDSLDILARTVIGEAGNQPDQGQQAVASTVFNRLNAGGYGKSIHDVVLAPKQFTSWRDPRVMIAIDQNSNDYKRAAKNVQAAAADDATDYSQGATHFYSPSGMRGGKAPSWAKNQTAQIGQHNFYAPYRTAQASDADVDRELQSFGVHSGTTAAGPAPISDDEVNKGLASFGLNTAAQQSSAAAPAGAQTTPGFAGPDGRPQLGISKGDYYAPPPTAAPSRMGDNLPAPFADVARDVRNAPGEAWSSASGAFMGGLSKMGQGWNALRAGDVLPSDLQWRPGTTTTLTGDQRATSTPMFANPGGLATALHGAGQVAGSPISALKPVGEMLNKTGNPELAGRLMAPAPMAAGNATLGAVLPTSRAMNTIIEGVGRENIPSVLKRLEANPRLSLMDVSEPMRTHAGALASDPELGGQNIMRSVSDARLDARKDIVRDAVTDTLGRSPNVKKTLDGYKANIRAVGTNQIDPIVKNAGLVDLSPVVKSIDDQLGPTITDAMKGGQLAALAHLSPEEQKLIEIRRKIVGGVPESDLGGAGEPAATMRLVDAAQAHKLQSQLRSEASSYMESDKGSERYVGGTVTMPIRQQIVDAIDIKTGGAYRKGLAKYREASHIDEAFEKGFNSLKAGGIEDFPEYWKAWKQEASPDEMKALRLGQLTAIRRTIGGFQGGARRGENVIAPDFIRERFETGFGPKRTQQLASLLQDARDMSETNARLYQGSKTATTIAGQNALRVREPGNVGASALTPVGLGAAAIAGGMSEAGLVGLGMGALRAAHVGTQYLRRGMDKSRNAHIAEMISAGEGPLRDQLMAALRAAQNPVGQPGLAQRASSFARSPLLAPVSGVSNATPANALAMRGGRSRDASGRFTSGASASP